MFAMAVLMAAIIVAVTVAMLVMFFVVMCVFAIFYMTSIVAVILIATGLDIFASTRLMQIFCGVVAGVYIILVDAFLSTVRSRAAC